MEKEKELTERIFDYLESGEVDKAVFGCLRLSKLLNDKFNTAIFLRELYPDKKQLDQALYEVSKDLSEDGRSFLWKTSAEHWLDERTCRFALSEDDPDKNILALGIGEITRELEDIDKSISDLTVPSGISGYDAMALTEKYDYLRPQLRLRKNALHTISERIKTRCFIYASRIESQIPTQEKTLGFLYSIQNSVNNYFAAHSDDTYQKLQSASKLISSQSKEDQALLLTSIRRAIASVADYFYPPKIGKHICKDGIERLLGPEQYLNRLGEFCTTFFDKSTANELLKSELNYFMTFAQKLNEIASKGVHTEVSSPEAKQGLLGLYLLLSNIIDRLDINT